MARLMPRDSKAFAPLIEGRGSVGVAWVVFACDNGGHSPRKALPGATPPVPRFSVRKVGEPAMPRRAADRVSEWDTLTPSLIEIDSLIVRIPQLAGAEALSREDEEIGYHSVGLLDHHEHGIQL
jgi:hypothetical protein